MSCVFTGHPFAHLISRANTACHQADLVTSVGRSLSGKSLGEGRLGVVQPDRPDLSSLM